MLSKSDLRKVMHRLVDVICDEAESNARLAERLQDALGFAGEETRRAPKKQAALDPFAVLEKHGVSGLRRQLNDMDLNDLKTIVRLHRFDPSRLSDKWKTRDRFVDLIVERVEARARQGSAFRDYKSQRDSSMLDKSNVGEAKDVESRSARSEARQSDDEEEPVAQSRTEAAQQAASPDEAPSLAPLGKTPRG